jgi:hypothetical protein
MRLASQYALATASSSIESRMFCRVIKRAHRIWQHWQIQAIRRDLSIDSLQPQAIAKISYDTGSQSGLFIASTCNQTGAFRTHAVSEKRAEFEPPTKGVSHLRQSSLPVRA